MTTEKNDTGLGLTEFLQKSEPAPQEATASPAPAETPKETPVEKPAEAPAEVPKTDIPTEAPKTDTPTAETPPSPDIRKGYEDRLKQTRDWATQINQENASLKRSLQMQQAQLEKVTKILDGTWTPEDEKRYNEPAFTPEQVAEFANFEGRIASSRESAYTMYGRDKVHDTLFAPDAPFRQIENDPVVRARIETSPAPVVEAMKIVKAKQFYETYGYDPDTIVRNIENSLREKVTKEVMKSLSQRGNIPTGLRDVQSSGSPNTTPSGYKPLSEIFGR